MSSPAANKPKHALHTQESSTKISKLLVETNNADIHFTLTYFELASVGSTARELLEYAGVNHTKNTVTVSTPHLLLNDLPSLFWLQCNKLLHIHISDQDIKSVLLLIEEGMERRKSFFRILISPHPDCQAAQSTGILKKDPFRFGRFSRLLFIFTLRQKTVFPLLHTYLYARHFPGLHFYLGTTLLGIDCN